MEQVKAVAAQFVKLLRSQKDNCLMMSDLLSEYSKTFGYTLRLHDYDVSSVPALMQKLCHVVKVMLCLCSLSFKRIYNMWSISISILISVSLWCTLQIISLNWGRILTEFKMYLQKSFVLADFLGGNSSTFYVFTCLSNLNNRNCLFPPDSAI